ncbi:hypothetical protein [Kineococcus rubinsiae]|uniref:hypothetical protein n=1 Tax=Kineococcus rubinsiae TaxID=2609562 RepID=UPI00142F5AA0|nr:hypothetical protein [Kineococcus rubinsiae]NIZ90073.1 hypothetical protein [Kineococcus rubinsiae]
MSRRPPPVDFVRSPKAVQHLTTFVVSAVTTILLTRTLLALTGYPQIGGGAGLHIAHVLPGGLLMAAALLLQLAYLGPGPRPLSAVLGGVGFGLFIDEVGKFVTTDNDYFYEPAAAIMYGVLAGVVVAGHTWRRRRPLDADERVAAAAHALVDGLAGRLPEHRRDEALRSLAKAGDSPAAAELRALLTTVPTSSPGVPQHVLRAWRAVAARVERASAAWWALPLMGVLLAGQALMSVLVLLEVWSRRDLYDVSIAGVFVGTAVSLVFVAAGLVQARRRGRRAAVESFQRSALASLLITQVCLFVSSQLLATAGLVVVLALLGLVNSDLARHRRQPR